MTVGSTVKKWMRDKWGVAFFPKSRDDMAAPQGGCEDVYTDDEEWVVTKDREYGMPFLFPDKRRMAEFYLDLSIVLRSVKTKPLYDGDERYTKTMLELVELVARRVTGMFAHEAIERVVLCFDDIDGSPPAKLASTHGRSASVKDVSADWPLENPITDDTDFSVYDIDDMWYHRASRIHFTQYITSYFVQRFCQMPEGKTLVLDGARLCDHPGNLCIVVETVLDTTVSTSDAVHMFRTARLVPRQSPHRRTCAFPTPEGELKAVAYAVHSERRGVSLVISSKDGDSIFAALLQWRALRHAAGRRTFKNTYYIQSTQSMGTEPYEPEVRERILAAHARRALGDPKARKPRTTRTVFCTQYISINALLACVEAWFRERFPGVRHPVETFCVLVALEGNDYVAKLPNTSFATIIRAWERAHAAIGNLVEVEAEAEPGGSAATASGVPVLRYSVSKEALVHLAYEVYCIKFPKLGSGAPDEHGTWAFRLDAFVLYRHMERRCTELKMKRGVPPLADIQRTAHNLAYYLTYFGNSANYAMATPSGLERSPGETGSSVYGFGLIDDASGVARDNVKFCNDVCSGDAVGRPVPLKPDGDGGCDAEPRALDVKLCFYVRKRFEEMIKTLDSSDGGRRSYSRKWSRGADSDDVPMSEASDYPH